MPERPKRPCKYPGCPELVTVGYCDKHSKTQRQQYDSNRPNAYRRGYNRDWQRYRKRYLTEHPLCIRCLESGNVEPATDVDHIIPHKGDTKLFWDRNNHQALCHSCHSKKTANENGGFGNG